MLPAYIIDRIRRETDPPPRQALPLRPAAEPPPEREDEPCANTQDDVETIDFTI